VFRPEFIGKSAEVKSEDLLRIKQLLVASIPSSGHYELLSKPKSDPEESRVSEHSE
jgi:hypothetical protein